MARLISQKRGGFLSLRLGMTRVTEVQVLVPISRAVRYAAAESRRDDWHELPRVFCFLLRFTLCQVCATFMISASAARARARLH